MFLNISAFIKTAALETDANSEQKMLQRALNRLVKGYSGVGIFLASTAATFKQIWHLQALSPCC